MRLQNRFVLEAQYKVSLVIYIKKTQNGWDYDSKGEHSSSMCEAQGSILMPQNKTIIKGIITKRLKALKGKKIKGNK